MISRRRRPLSTQLATLCGSRLPAGGGFHRVGDSSRHAGNVHEFVIRHKVDHVPLHRVRMGRDYLADEFPSTIRQVGQKTSTVVRCLLPRDKPPCLQSIDAVREPAFREERLLASVVMRTPSGGPSARATSTSNSANDRPCELSWSRSSWLSSNVDPRMIERQATFRSSANPLPLPESRFSFIAI